MITDIRLDVGFPGHKKTLRLIRRLSDPAAPWLLIKLWIYVAQQLPDGVLLGMDDEDIEGVAGWDGEPGLFAKALKESGYIDVGDDGMMSCHDWLDHNPWVASSNDRSGANRFTRLAQVAPNVFAELKKLGVKSLNKKDYELAKKAEIAGKPLADVISNLANVGERQRNASETPANASATLAPVPIPIPIPKPNPINDDVSSQASTTPLPPTTDEKPSSSEKMSTNEFRFLFQEATGSLMPGGCNQQASELCRYYSREQIKSAFEITAVQGGKTLKYVASVLEGKPKPDARSRDRPGARSERLRSDFAAIDRVAEAINASQGV